MMGRVSGDCFDMRRSWERASMRAASETELSFETRLRIVRGLGLHGLGRVGGSSGNRYRQLVS